jgi:hypothetical protein
MSSNHNPSIDRPDRTEVENKAQQVFRLLREMLGDEADDLIVEIRTRIGVGKFPWYAKKADDHQGHLYDDIIEDATAEYEP